MFTDAQREFLEKNHQGILTAYKKDGTAQLSIVGVGLYEDGVAFTTAHDRFKRRNLFRNPRCSLLVTTPEFRPYLVLEGLVRIHTVENTGAEPLRLKLREVYRAIHGEDHPDWDEYDRRMVEERRAVYALVPEHSYGTRGWS